MGQKWIVYKKKYIHIYEYIHEKQRMKNLFDFRFFKNFNNSKP